MFVHAIDEKTTLSRVELRDAREIFALVDQSRDHLREWLPWVDASRTVRDTEAFLRRALQQHAENDGFQCCIRYEGQLAGVVGFHRVDWAHKQTEIGYWLAPAFQGRGIMTRACRALVDFAFREYDLNRVEIRAAVGNKKSRAIPERLGFTREGTLREFEWVNDHFVDGVVYSMLRREWAESRAEP